MDENYKVFSQYLIDEEHGEISNSATNSLRKDITSDAFRFERSENKVSQF